MKERKGKIFGILTAVGVFMIPIIQAIISHKIENINYIEALKNIYLSIFNFIKSVLTTNIPLWAILIGILTLFMIIKIYIKFIANKEQGKAEIFEWDNYKQEKYDG